MLYAQIDRDTNLMIGEPRTLPYTFTTPGGTVITGFHKLSIEELDALDWLQVWYDVLPSFIIYKFKLLADVVPVGTVDVFVFRFEACTAAEIETAVMAGIEAAVVAKVTDIGFTTTEGNIRFLSQQIEVNNYRIETSPSITDYPILNSIVTKTSQSVATVIAEIQSAQATETSRLADVIGLKKEADLDYAAAPDKEVFMNNTITAIEAV